MGPWNHAFASTHLGAMVSSIISLTALTDSDVGNDLYLSQAVRGHPYLFGTGKNESSFSRESARGLRPVDGTAEM